MRTVILSTAIALMMTLPATAAAPDETITIWGTGSYTIEGVVTFGVGLCLTSGTGTELECGSDLTSRGTGSFDVSGWSPSSGSGRFITVEAQLNGLRPGPVTGYNLVLCSDLDDSTSCFLSDFFADAHSNAAGYATLTTCIPVDDVAGGSDYDDINVFISSWVDPSASSNPPAGVSEGAYVVSVTYGGYVASC